MKVMRVLIVLLLAALGAGQITGCAATATDDKSAGTTVDDTVINTRVKTALLEDPQVKGTEVQVETFKGVVQLSGFVDSAAIADRAVPGCGNVMRLSVRQNLASRNGRGEQAELDLVVGADHD